MGLSRSGWPLSGAPWLKACCLHPHPGRMDTGEGHCCLFGPSSRNHGTWAGVGWEGVLGAASLDTAQVSTEFRIPFH